MSPVWTSWGEGASGLCSQLSPRLQPAPVSWARGTAPAPSPPPCTPAMHTQAPAPRASSNHNAEETESFQSQEVTWGVCAMLRRAQGPTGGPAWAPLRKPGPPAGQSLAAAVRVCFPTPHPGTGGAYRYTGCPAQARTQHLQQGPALRIPCLGHSSHVGTICPSEAPVCVWGGMGTRARLKAAPDTTAAATSTDPEAAVTASALGASRPAWHLRCHTSDPEGWHCWSWGTSEVTIHPPPPPARQPTPAPRGPARAGPQHGHSRRRKKGHGTGRGARVFCRAQCTSLCPAPQAHGVPEQSIIPLHGPRSFCLQREKRSYFLKLTEREGPGAPVVGLSQRIHPTQVHPVPRDPEAGR